MKTYVLVLVTVLLVTVCPVALGAPFVPLSGVENEGIGSGLFGMGARRRSQVYSVAVQDWEYWESENAAEYDDAARDCKDNGDILLYLESEGRMDNVNTWLQDSESTGSLYWVGGRYDVDRDMFIWENGIPFGLDVPWAPGEPREKTVNTRVVASTVGREIKLKTQVNKTTLRYICKYL